MSVRGKCYACPEKAIRRLRGYPICRKCYQLAIEHCAHLSSLPLSRWGYVDPATLKGRLPERRIQLLLPGSLPRRLEALEQFLAIMYIEVQVGRPRSSRLIRSLLSGLQRLMRQSQAVRNILTVLQL